MSNEGDRAAVFRTTKVRTKLMGDNWWMQSTKNPEPEPPQAQEEEKPWVAEMRASRLNVPPVESSPVAYPTDPTPVKPAADRAPPSGYLIRGVFTKTESKPAATSTTNGFSGRSGSFTKRPSDTYKKIAPHTVRTAPETTSVETEGQLSPEEQERRREAASNVLKTSSVRKRSYVLSAAKKYENTEKPPDTSEVTGSPAFVAKRVEITDDDDEPSVTPLSPGSPASPVPSLAALLSSISPVPSSPAAVPEPTAQTTVEANVETMEDEPVAPAVTDVVPEPVKEEVVPPVPSLAEDPTVATTTTAEIEEDPFAHMKPGCIKVFIPLPYLPPECVLVEEEACKDPRPVDSDDSGREDTPPPSPVQGSNVLECSVPEEDAVKTDPRPDVSPKHSAAESLDALSETLISFDTGSTSLLDTQDENDPCDSVIPAPDSFKEAETVLEDDDTEQVDTPSDHSIDPEPTPEVSNCIVMTDDLLSLTDGPEELSAEPVPSSPRRWGHDLLGPTDSDSDQVKTSSSLDLLADDVIPINTERNSLSTEQSCNDDISDNTTAQTEDTTPRLDDATPCMVYTTLHTDDTAPHTAKDTQREDGWMKPSSQAGSTAARSMKNLADPFDPYPIGRTSPNSSADLTSHTPRDEEEHPSPQIMSMSGDALDSLAEDVIPIDTDTERLHSERSWSRTWETGVPEHTTATVEESPTPIAPAGHVEEQRTVVTFERKSSENDSPWDRWTSPTVYAVAPSSQEEEEEGDEDEQEPEGRETHHSDLEPVMDRYQTYSSTTDVEETRRVETPEPESKKGFVLVKEYVNAGELSLHNARDQGESGSEYLTSSSSSSSSYSRPNYSRVSESSTCTYCGEQVGNDAKITIEHLNISCHPDCFQCGVCSRPMGDLLYNMFLHGGKVHCESCYSKVFD